MPCSMYWTRAELDAGHMLAGDTRNDFERHADDMDKMKRLFKEEFSEVNNKYQSMVNDLTAKLCQACEIIDANEPLEAYGDLYLWYVKHKKWDQEREHNEKI